MRLLRHNNDSQHISIELSEIVEQLRTGTFEPQIKALPDPANKAEYNQAKKRLPSWFFNGDFVAGTVPKNTTFTRSSGYFHFDVDSKDNPGMSVDDMKQKLMNVHGLALLFTSPSRTGVKGLIRISDDYVKSDDDFKRVHQVMSKYIKLFGINIDQSRSDVRSACFVSYDPDVYYNPDVNDPGLNALLEMYGKPEPLAREYDGSDNETVDWLGIHKALNHISPDCAEPIWFRVCSALKCLGDEGFKLFDSWSAKATIPNYYNEADTADKWNTSAGTKSGWRALFNIAKECDPSYVNTGRSLDLAEIFRANANTIFIPPPPASNDSILDRELALSELDLLRHLPDSVLIKRLSVAVAKACNLPSSSVFVNLLGIYSSMACRQWRISYPNGQGLPIGMYVIVEQPSGTGKSRCQGVAQNPFFNIKKDVVSRYRDQVKQLSNVDKPTEDQKLKLEELLANREFINSRPFISNATAEGAEATLNHTGGFFASVSSEQGLFNSLLGLTYSKGESNNDLILNGFDAGYMSSCRISRNGYHGRVIGGCVLFAQQGSIEKALNASNGTGLSERFLMLVEPHRLGIRDHLEHHTIDERLLAEYANKCEFARAVFGVPTSFDELLKLEITPSGYRLIDEFRNSIEPHLRDGGKFSHVSMRGAASKVNMQIMKIAANLWLLERDSYCEWVIPDRIVAAAINIASDLLESNLKLLTVKEIVGTRAEFGAIIGYLSKGGKSGRDIKNCMRTVKPFKDFTGNKPELIDATLKEMVQAGTLKIITEGCKAVYHLNQ